MEQPPAQEVLFMHPCNLGVVGVTSSRRSHTYTQDDALSEGNKCMEEEGGASCATHTREPPPTGAAGGGRSHQPRFAEPQRGDAGGKLVVCAMMCSKGNNEVRSGQMKNVIPP